MAVTRPMRRMRAVLQFADAPIRGRQNLGRAARQLGAFLTANPEGQPGSDTGGVWFGSPESDSGRLPVPDAGELELLQMKVRRLLDVVVGRRVHVGDPNEPETADLSVLSATDLLLLELKPPRMVPVIGSDGSVTLKAIDGSFSDRVLMAMLLLLAHAGAGSIRACQVCGRAFVKEGKRLHCGRKKCADRSPALRFQRWKASAKGRRYLKENVYEPHGWTPGWEKGKETR